MNFKQLKGKKGGLPLNYVKPTCCQNTFHKRHGQLDFHFLILLLKYDQELESFIFPGIYKPKFLETGKIQFLYYILLSWDFWHIILYAFVNHMVLFH